MLCSIFRFVILIAMCLASSASTAIAQIHPDDATRPIPVAEQETVTVTGILRDAAGKPVENAKVALTLSEHSRSARPSGIHVFNWLPVQSRYSGPFETDAEGKFVAEGVRRRNAAHIGMAIVAMADGHGFVSKTIETHALNQTVELKLKPEKVVRGRVIDLKGQPAVGATVRIAYWGVKPSKEVLPLWKRVRTDDKGRFILRGLNDDDVRIEVQHEDLASHQEKVNTFPLSSKDKVTISVAAAHTIYGRVTCEDTGKPAVGAVVVAPAADMGPLWTFTRTDSEGNYHLNPFPPSSAMSFGYPKAYYLNVFPANEEPYIVARPALPLKRAASQEVNIVLKRGIVIHGRVTDDAGVPVAGARIQIKPTPDPNFGDRPFAVAADPEPGQLQVAISQDDGSYELAAPHGSAKVFVLGPTLDFIPVEHKTDTSRRYADAFKELKVSDTTKRHEMNFTLQRGITLKGKVVGPDGTPSPKFEITTHSYMASGYKPNTNLTCYNGTFELHGCDPNKVHAISIFDKANDLGASLRLTKKHASEPAVAKLRKCGTAKIRFVDDAGKPHEQTSPQLTIVLRDGVPKRAYMDKNDELEWPEEGEFRDLYFSTQRDDAGYVRVNHLVPGTEYQLCWHPSIEKFRLPTPWPHVRFKVEPGENLKLDDVTVSSNE